MIVEKAVKMAKMMNVDVLGLVENMSYVLCPDCGKKIEVFGKSKADALLCDAFSNPTIAQIGSRIRPFIEAVRKHNPKMPIIFLNTIYRENRNFKPSYDQKEQSRIEFVEKTMKEVVKEYKGVYFVNVPNQTGTDHVTSADGVHPYSYGYHRWAQAIEKPVMKILKKHKIK